MYLKPVKFKGEVEQHFLKYFSESQYENICKALATPPLTTYFRQTKFTEGENDDAKDFINFQTSVQNFIDKVITILRFFLFNFCFYYC